MFFMSSISVAIVASLATLNDTLSVLLATAFGFLLSQDLITSSKIPLYLLSLLSRAKILRSVYVQVTDKTFTSFYGWDCQTMSDLKFLAVHYVISIIKGATLLAASLVIVYFTFLSNGNAEELGTKIAAGIVIGLFCLLQGSNILQRIYLFGVLRNPLFPMQAENVTKFNKRRKLLHYVSIPARIIHAYGEFIVTSKKKSKLNIPDCVLYCSVSPCDASIYWIQSEDTEHINFYPSSLVWNSGSKNPKKGTPRVL